MQEHNEISHGRDRNHRKFPGNISIRILERSNSDKLILSNLLLENHIKMLYHRIFLADDELIINYRTKMVLHCSLKEKK